MYLFSASYKKVENKAKVFLFFADKGLVVKKKPLIGEKI